MSLLAGKFVSEIVVNTAAEKHYKVFKHTAFHIPNISPKIIKEVKVHEGDWDTHGHGSIKIWKYIIEGKLEFVKERVEFDDEKMLVSLIALEGDVFENYKAFTVSYQFVPKDPTKSLAILTLEYEKLNEETPYPYQYLALMNDLIKDIESHHLK